MQEVASNQTMMLKSIDVFTGGLALLAFVMALYALAAREQKTPYITNSVYSTALFVLLAILLSTLSEIVRTKTPSLADFLAWTSTVLLGVGVLNVFYKVWQAQNRKLNFRNDHLFKNLRVVRRVKNIKRTLWRRPSYEHNPIGLHKPLLDSIRQCTSLPREQLEKAVERGKSLKEFALSLSATYRVSNLSESDELLTELAVCFLQHDCWVQYATCARHPIEFVIRLRRKVPEDHQEQWAKMATHIIAVDAYSPHFGFTDSIHEESTKKLEEMGIRCVTAKSSYAGLHTAAAQAFNKIKKSSRAKDGQQARSPTLVIYEGLYALVELESAEQYRVFIRHLMPSERLWGGMFTIVAETTIAEQDLSLLQTYTDIFVDKTNDSRSGITDHPPYASSAAAKQSGEQQ